MRILIAHSFYRLSGGEDRYVRQQVRLLRRRHDVFLLARHNRELRGGVHAAATMLYSSRVLRETDDAIATFRPDVIHLHNAYPALGPAIFLSSRSRRVPLVMTVHNYRLRCPNGLQFTQGSICSRCVAGGYHNAVLHPCFPSSSQRLAYASSLWIHRFILKLENSVSRFICPSEFMRATLDTWGIPRTRTALLRNYVPSVPDASTSPGAFGAYVGRLSHEKGVHVLLRALRHANDPPFRIVGDGPASAALRRLARQLELKNTVFAGTLPEGEVDGVLRAARFAVLPSLWNENAPLAALEAMARGRPLVVSAVGGLQELAADGRGHVVSAGDVPALASAIARLMTSDEGCSRAGAAALAFVRSELTPERHLGGLELSYDTAITEG